MRVPLPIHMRIQHGRACHARALVCTSAPTLMRKCTGICEHTGHMRAQHRHTSTQTQTHKCSTTCVGTFYPRSGGRRRKTNPTEDTMQCATSCLKQTRCTRERRTTFGRYTRRESYSALSVGQEPPAGAEPDQRQGRQPNTPDMPSGRQMAPAACAHNAAHGAHKPSDTPQTPIQCPVKGSDERLKNDKKDGALAMHVLMLTYA